MDSGRGEHADDLVGAVLGAAEDQRPLDRSGLQELDQQRLLFGLVDEGDALLDPLDGGRDGSDRNFGGVGEIAVGQFLDRPRHGGREEQGLALGRDQGDDPLQAWMKPRSSIWSASSRTRISRSRRLARAGRPGRAGGPGSPPAHRAPRETSRTLLPLGMPPKKTPTDSFTHLVWRSQFQWILDPESSMVLAGRQIDPIWHVTSDRMSPLARR